LPGECKKLLRGGSNMPMEVIIRPVILDILLRALVKFIKGSLKLLIIFKKTTQNAVPSSD